MPLGVLPTVAEHLMGKLRHRQHQLVAQPGRYAVTASVVRRRRFPTEEGRYAVRCHRPQLGHDEAGIEPTQDLVMIPASNGLSTLEPRYFSASASAEAPFIVVSRHETHHLSDLRQYINPGRRHPCVHRACLATLPSHSGEVDNGDGIYVLRRLGLAHLRHSAVAALVPRRHRPEARQPRGADAARPMVGWPRRAAPCQCR
jgi:hypothetical protein